MKILAIDLGKFKSVACLLDTDNNQTEFQTIPTFCWAFEQLLHTTQPQQVVFETGAVSGWVHDLCQGLGYRVVVANPNADAWKWQNVKRKTDKDDALKLAKLSALGQIQPVHMPTLESRQYKRLVKFRKDIVRRINQLKNGIRSLLCAQGMNMLTSGKAWTIEGLAMLENHRKPLSECSIEQLWRGELDVDLTLLDTLSEQLNNIEKYLTQLAKHEERVQLLMTIPGVGRCTAEVIVTSLDDPHRFQNARQVSSYAGLVPRQHQTGQTNRLGRISKHGSKLLRSTLVEGAWLSLQYNPWAVEIFNRISGGQKTRRKTAIVAVARKLLVRCWAMLRHNEPWNPDLMPQLIEKVT
jgi:transposase